MKKFVLGILLASFALLAILALLPDGGDDSGSAQDDPTWNLFLSLREKSFRPSTREGHSAIEDAKYLWENVTASKWKGGDFLRTDLTRNSSEATRFLELENPESWYLANTFQNTDEAAELRAIIKAVGTRPEDESFFLREEFVKALAKSSKQLIDADLSDIDTVAVAFLEQQQAQLLDIPENNLSEWPTPADGRRATVLFETISELSRTAPPERRIRTWDDLFSEDVVSATVVAAEVNSNPVAASQWELMKPIVAWAKSIQ